MTSAALAASWGGRRLLASSPLLLRRRVVVTGMGAVTPLGNTLPSTWGGVLGIAPTDDATTSRGPGVTSLERALLSQNLPPPQFDAEWAAARDLPCQVAAAVRDDDGDSERSFPRDPRTARSVQFALAAGEEAVRGARLAEYLGFDDADDDDGGGGAKNGEVSEDEFRRRRERVGASVGCGMSSPRELALASSSNLHRLSPHFVPKILPNSSSARLALRYNLGGPNLCPSTACAAGAHAVGDAVRAIQHGDADVMLAGGSESTVDPISMAGFCRLRALSTSFNDSPQLASRPFDDRRDGFVLGEGAAVLVLEELGHAIQRNAPILCEVAGYAATGDGYHVTSPDPTGWGAARAMAAALRSAGIAPGDVDYVNAHATSTPAGDSVELRAIRDALLLPCQGGNGGGGEGGGEERRTGELHVSSTKGATGHLLGAAGAAEAAFAVLAVSEGRIPPTRNLEGGCGRDHDDGASSSWGLNLVSGESPLSPEGGVSVALSNSFGFGGTNACLVFKAYDGS